MARRGLREARLRGGGADPAQAADRRHAHALLARAEQRMRSGQSFQAGFRGPMRSVPSTSVGTGLLRSTRDGPMRGPGCAAIF